MKLNIIFNCTKGLPLLIFVAERGGGKPLALETITFIMVSIEFLIPRIVSIEPLFFLFNSIISDKFTVRFFMSRQKCKKKLRVHFDCALFFPHTNAHGAFTLYHSPIHLYVNQFKFERKKCICF